MLIEDGTITFRAVLVGESSVGKTSILNRFIHHRFNLEEANTIGVSYESYSGTRLGHDIEVQVWDTAGTEQYRSLTHVYFRDAAAAIIVYDITNRGSFTSLENWLTLFRSYANRSALIVVVGNKLDLSDSRKTSFAEAEEWAATNHCRYTETSAQTGDGVDQLFQDLLDQLVEHGGCELKPTVIEALEAAEPAGRGCC